MQSFLLISIVSFFIQNIIGYLKFRKLINPIFLFTIIHFFHNWSFSLSKYFDEFLIWRSDLSVSYSSINEVLLINIIGSWAFFAAIIIFANTKQFENYFKIKNSNILLNGYYFLSFVFAFKYIPQLTELSTYGQNQAFDSLSSFDPISRILFFRIIFLLVYIIVERVSFRSALKFLAIEAFLSILIGERKDFVLIFSSLLLMSFQNNQFISLISLKYLFYLVTVSFFLAFIPIFRSIDYVNSFSQKILEAFELFKEFGSQIFFYVINLTNSEGVQNWTYQLIESGELQLQYGRSYLHAILNTIILRPFQGETIANWQAAYHFKNTAYPGDTNQGWDFTFTAEAIQNFGSYSFISFLILGISISMFYNNRYRNDFYKVLYFSCWPILTIAFRTDSTSMIRLFSYLLFTFLIIYIFRNFEKESDLKNMIN